MSPRRSGAGQPSPLPEPAAALADTLALLRDAVVAPPLGQGLTLLYTWRHLLEQAPFPGARNLAQDVSDLATLLHAGPMDEVPFQMALIAAQLRPAVPYLPEALQPHLLELAEHLARLAQTGAGPRPLP